MGLHSNCYGVRMLNPGFLCSSVLGQGLSEVIVLLETAVVLCV